MKISYSPGPGSYSYSIKREGPQYSLRGRDYSDSEDNLPAPGPGRYSPNFDCSLEKLPSYSLSLSKRGTSMASNRSPGPGTYDYRTTLSGPNWGFGSTARSVSYGKSVPGPGSYNIDSSFSKISYSFSPRRPQIGKLDRAPGPGTYDSKKKRLFP